MYERMNKSEQEDNIQISIIVAIYNVKQYLKQCIESLLAQSLKNIEVILVDDGSTDGSSEICDEYAIKDPRIKLIHQSNQGVSVARNAGIDIACGEWITFVDGDDWVSPEMCEKAIQYAEVTDSDVVVFSNWLYSQNQTKGGKPIDLKTGIVTDRIFLMCKTISHLYGGTNKANHVSAGTAWGKIIRRQTIIENNIYFVPGLIRAQDTVFWLYCFKYARKISYLDERLYYYRASDTSITKGNKYIPNCDEPFRTLLSEYKRFIDIYENEELNKAFDLRVIVVLRWYFTHYFFNMNNKINLKKRARQFIYLRNSEPFKTSIKHVIAKWLSKRENRIVFICKYHLFIPSYLLYRIIIFLRCL